MHLCALIARHQISRGRFFLFEQADRASSLGLEEYRAIMEAPGVLVAQTDQCEFGVSVSPDGQLSRKRTVLVANSQLLLSRCVRECSGSHPHPPLEGGRRTSRAERYPDQPIEALVAGVEDAGWWFHHSASSHFVEPFDDVEFEVPSFPSRATEPEGDESDEDVPETL
eukprot:4319899-Pyramimonas_sp.AAC.2